MVAFFMAVAWQSIAFLPSCSEKKDVVGNVCKTDPPEQIYRHVFRKHIMDCMQNGYSGGLGIGSYGASRHPVVTMDDNPASVLCPDVLDQIIDDLFLKFRCGHRGSPE